MTMLNATYSFFVQADGRATRVMGSDVATPDGNVTLAEGHAR